MSNSIRQPRLSKVKHKSSKIGKFELSVIVATYAASIFEMGAVFMAQGDHVSITLRIVLACLSVGSAMLATALLILKDRL